MNPKEFFNRWKKGMEMVTPLQQLNIQIQSTRIILFGILCGLVMCALNIKSLWWLGIILAGSLMNTYVSYAGMNQKYKQFLELEKQASSFDNTQKGGKEVPYV